MVDPARHWHPAPTGTQSERHDASRALIAQAALGGVVDRQLELPAGRRFVGVPPAPAQLARPPRRARRGATGQSSSRSASAAEHPQRAEAAGGRAAAPAVGAAAGAGPGQPRQRLGRRQRRPAGAGHARAPARPRPRRPRRRPRRRARSTSPSTARRAGARRARRRRRRAAAAASAGSATSASGPGRRVPGTRRRRRCSRPAGTSAPRRRSRTGARGRRGAPAVVVGSIRSPRSARSWATTAARGPGSSSGASSAHVWCWATTSVSGPIVNRPRSLVEHAGRPLGRGQQRQPVLGQRRRRPQLAAGPDGVPGVGRAAGAAGPVARRGSSRRPGAPARRGRRGGSARRATSSGSRSRRVRPAATGSGAPLLVDREARRCSTSRAARAAAAPRPRRRRAARRCRRARASTMRAHASSSCVGDRLAAELPDHGAQLELGGEAQPVVDGPDAVAASSRQWPLLRSVLLATRSNTAIVAQLVVQVGSLLVDREVVLRWSASTNHCSEPSPSGPSREHGRRHDVEAQRFAEHGRRRPRGGAGRARSPTAAARRAPACRSPAARRRRSARRRGTWR